LQVVGASRIAAVPARVPLVESSDTVRAYQRNVVRNACGFRAVRQRPCLAGVLQELLKTFEPLLRNAG